MPLAEAEGVVVAVVVRHNDAEDKLIVARPGTAWTDAELLAAVEFQERFFVSKLVRLPS